MEHYETDRETVYEWSIWEAAEALCGPQPTPHGNSRYDVKSRRAWTGSSLADCQRWITEGWEEGAEVLDVGDSTTTVVETDGFEYTYEQEGCDPDVGAYLAGEIECMGDVRRARVPKPLVRIGVDLAISNYNRSEDLLAAGRSVLTMVESLRARGYPTEVYCEWRVSSDRLGLGRRLRAVVKVQPADQPVHGGILAFWVAHPSAMRRGIEALVETLPWDVRQRYGFTTGGGYGYPLPIREDAYDEAAPSIQIGGVAAVRAWVEEVLSRRA